MHLGLIGYGNIGQELIRRMPRDVVSEITVLQRRETTPKQGIMFVHSITDLIDARPSLVVECAGHAAAENYLIPLLQAGLPVMPASLGVFSDESFLQDARAAAQQSQSELIIPSGAIGGLDILRAVATSSDAQATYRGTKPPSAWKGSPAEEVVELDTLTEQKVFFTGSARDAAAAYPKNANVVAALALAGPGFDRVSVELIADPAATSNEHSYEVMSSICSYHMTIQNAASAGNARTSETTILSLLCEVQAFSQRIGHGT